MRKVFWMVLFVITLCCVSFSQHKVVCVSASELNTQFCIQTSLDKWDGNTTNLTSELPVNNLYFSDNSKWQTNRGIFSFKMLPMRIHHFMSQIIYPKFRVMVLRNEKYWSLRHSSGFYIYNIRKIII
ncbi:MAG TPA: hypothetical protein PLN63_04840 [Paludibacteraceae bacterium]|jgi:hypothetical protein|nr:hypothetical protein [Paludibacteraceae bacterium]HPH62927.1 hypothetical protein [Paludibacteraceae bacterium]